MNIKQALLSSAIAAASLYAFAGVAAHAQAGPPTPAATGNAGVPDVVITARKRAENTQRIPVAVTSNTGRQLAQQGIRQTTDLGRVVPSLVAAVGASEPNGVTFSIRGQAAGDVLLTISQPVGVYEDTVNIPHPVGLQGAFFDIDRVEVLNGPQGTLYGRNTTGGAINFITRGADYNGLHGFVMGEVGNYNDWKIGGAVNVPIISDVFSARLAFQHWSRDGFGESVITHEKLGDDHNDNIARLSLRFDPSANFHAITKIEYGNLDSNGLMTTARQIVPITVGGLTAEEFAGEGLTFPYHLNANGVITNLNLFKNYSEQNQFTKTTTWHAVQDMTWDISDDLKFRSITGFHSVLNREVGDLDALQIHGSTFGQFTSAFPSTPPGLFTQPNPRFISEIPPESNYHSYTQEFDLSGHSYDRLDWLIGAFASTETGVGAEPQMNYPLAPAGILGPNAGFENYSNTVLSNGEKTDTWAVFTQSDLHISDRVSLTLGARYTEEMESNKSSGWVFNGVTDTYSCSPSGNVVPTGQDPNRFCMTAVSANPLIGPNLQVGHTRSNGVSYLASFNYQWTPTTLLYLKTSRGFRGGALQFRDAGAPGVKPEIATDYEIGLKNDLFDHRLRLNLAAYHTSYQNKQETFITVGPGGLTTILVNAAQAQINGVEASFAAQPTRDWSIYGTATYLNGQYISYKNPLSLVDAAPLVPFSCVGLAPPPPLPGAPACTLHNIPFANPHWQYNIGTRYQHEVGPGVLAGELDWSWHDKAVQNILTTEMVVGPAIGLDNSAQRIANDESKALGLLNGRIDYTMPDQQLTVAFFVTNLLNTHYQTASLPPLFFGESTAVTGDPLMFGFQLTKAFGHGD